LVIIVIAFDTQIKMIWFQLSSTMNTFQFPENGCIDFWCGMILPEFPIEQKPNRPTFLR
jgi:hypothetical protein